MTETVREELKAAQENAEEEYDLWAAKRAQESDEWAALGFGVIDAPKPTITSAIKLVKANWGKIGTLAAAFGIPIGVAEPGAFGKVFNLLSNFWPF